MSWRIVRQPNERYSRFSEVSDDFTRMNMTWNAAWELCRNDVGPRIADEKMRAADADRSLWMQALEVIRTIYGDEQMRKRLAAGCANA